jgi:CBS domain containing-hemolysin-like protein
MDWISLFSLLISLLLIGFLSGIEVAFITANKLNIELKKKQGKITGRTWSEFNENPAKFIGTILVGLNIIFVIYGLLIGDMLFPVWAKIKSLLHNHVPEEYIDYVRLLVETILSTTIILFTQFLSKAFFKSRSNSIVNSGAVSYLIHFFYRLLSSLSTFFVELSEWILKYVFNVKLRKKNESLARYELEHYLNQGKKNEDEDSSAINQELFENALTFSEVKIRKCMIPRKEIEGLEVGSSVDLLTQRFIDTKLSKIIIYEGNIENILGYIHHLDLLRIPASINEIIHPIPTVPESMSATDLMTKFTKERKSIAWVIDEFGGTAGIVTMEDLLEELFGEIEDEYDIPEDLVEKKLSQDEFIFSGRLELDDLSEKYHIKFDRSEHAETLSGYIIQKNESIPKQKDRIVIGELEFEILHVTDTRIETVKLKMLN